MVVINFWKAKIGLYVPKSFLIEKNSLKISLLKEFLKKKSSCTFIHVGFVDFLKKISKLHPPYQMTLMSFDKGFNLNF